MNKKVSTIAAALTLSAMLAVPAFAETTGTTGVNMGTATPTPAVGTPDVTNTYGAYGTGTYGTSGYNNYGTYGTTGTGAYRTNAADNDTDDWGWLGLLGLVGLAGMMGRDRGRDRDRNK